MHCELRWLCPPSPTPPSNRAVCLVRRNREDTLSALLQSSRR
jgi:hypothetical protein